MWGASYLLIKVSLEDLSPVAIVFVRTALAVLVLLPVAVWRRALQPVRRVIGWVALVGVVQVSAPFLLIAIGELHVSSLLTGILVSSTPIFTAMLALRFDADERSEGWRLVGLGGGTAGVVLLLGVDLSGAVGPFLGAMAVLLANVSYSIGALIVKHRLSGVPPVGLAASTMMVSTVLLLPAVPFALPEATPSSETIGAMLMLGVGGTGLAFFLVYTLIADVGPARTALVTYIAPGFAVLYGSVLLDEAITLTTMVGLALILGGSYLGAQGWPSVRFDPGCIRR